MQTLPRREKCSGALTVGKREFDLKRMVQDILEEVRTLVRPEQGMGIKRMMHMLVVGRRCC